MFHYCQNSNKGRGTQKDAEGAKEMMEASLERDGEDANPGNLVGLAVYHLSFTKDIDKG